MLQREWATAQNIKDRVNRKNVQRVIKRILEGLAQLKTIPETGLFIFAGITDREEEPFLLLQPPFPNKHNYYRCDSKFHTWMVAEFYKERKNGGEILILVSGEKSLIYRISSEVVLFKTVEGSLIKRHRKGGQSSIRFARLAEESRHHYIEKIIETIRETIDRNARITVSGGRELGQQLVEQLKKKSWNKVDYIDKWVNFTENTYKQETKEILEHFDNYIRETEEIKIKTWLDTMPECANRIGYANDEKDDRNIEKVVCIEDVEKSDKWPVNSIFTIRKNSPLYVILKKLGGVVIWYYQVSVD